MLNWFLRRSQPNLTRWLPKILLAETLGWKLLSICERRVLLLRPKEVQLLMLNVGAAGPTERWMPSTLFTSRPRLGGRIALLLRDPAAQPGPRRKECARHPTVGRASGAYVQHQ